MANTLIANAALVKTRIATNLGSLTASSGAGSVLQFGCPDISSMYRGKLNISCAAGAVTGPTWLLECSIDNGLTWFVLTATTYTISGQVSGDAAPLYAASYDISGLAGATFKFALTAGTGITATSVWALIG